MGLTLDMSPRALEEVIYFAAYVVIDPKDTPLEHKSIMTEREYRERHCVSLVTDHSLLKWVPKLSKTS